MTEAERVLIEVSAATGAGAPEALERALERAASTSNHTAVEEMLLQSYLFVGFPSAINGLARWRGLTDSTAALVEPFQPDEWLSRGERVCQTVYAGQYRRLRENVRVLHPNLEDWMLAEGYGKVLGRPGLELRLRELGIVALLACQDAPTQLHSHLRGALNAGAQPAEIDETLAIASDFAAPERIQAARQLWARVHRRGTSAG